MIVPLGKHRDRDGALEDVGEDSGDHVSGVVLVGGDIVIEKEVTTDEDGEDVEENERKAYEGGKEAKGEGEEDEA